MKRATRIPAVATLTARLCGTALLIVSSDVWAQADSLARASAPGVAQLRRLAGVVDHERVIRVQAGGVDTRITRPFITDQGLRFSSASNHFLPNPLPLEVISRVAVRDRKWEEGLLIGVLWGGVIGALDNRPSPVCSGVGECAALGAVVWGGIGFVIGSLIVDWRVIYPAKPGAPPHP